MDINIGRYPGFTSPWMGGGGDPDSVKPLRGCTNFAGEIENPPPPTPNNVF